jgi:putative nucleotidyltransferase with HDIG domain
MKSSRLGQWVAPRPGSGSQLVWLTDLCKRDTLARMSLVVATALTLALLSYFWGLPLPYRIGERWAHDVRARVEFTVIDDDATEVARSEAVKKLPPILRDDPDARRRARDMVPPIIERIRRGTIIISRNDTISESQRALMQEETRAFQKAMPSTKKLNRIVALLMLMGLMATLTVLYTVRYQEKLANDTTQIFRVCLLVVAGYLAWLILARPPWHGGLFPLTVVAMTLAIAYRPPFALMICFSLSMAVTASRGNGMDHLLIQVGGQSVAVLLMRNIRSRTQLIKIGAWAGLSYLAMTLTASLLTDQTGELTLSDSARRFLWAFAAGFLVTGALPLIERWFGIITDIRLQELADGTHPLLQELVRRAPGTCNHSMTVASLAEQAAEVIGANPLMTRVGAYFHDIGKMLKPSYFIENQSGQNMHDTLEPGLSTLIIIGHVKDGVALAEQYRLPPAIVDFIQQHHGTTLVEYFYRVALRQQGELGNTPTRGEGTPCALESSFRYPGPKPQTRETGIVMLSDCVESASRALSDPTPSSLRKLVRDLTMKRLLDGQLEESGLTLTDIHQIEDALVKGLTALYHSRIKYPPDPRDRRVA